MQHATTVCMPSHHAACYDNCMRATVTFAKCRGLKFKIRSLQNCVALLQKSCPQSSAVGSRLVCSTWLQVALPAGGSRLLMGSKSFWESIPFKQSVKSVRCQPARAVATALQRVAMKEPGKAQPTIFVADLLPVGPSQAAQLDFQHMKMQVCQSME